MSLLSTAPSQVVAATIDVGTHPHAKILGLTINTDTVLTTLIAGAILLAVGFYMRLKAQTGIPSKLQLIFETIVDGVNKQVEESMGIKVAPFVVPLAVTLFCFILLCNWIGLIPSGHPEKLPAPTADINLTLALAIAVIIPLHIVSIRRRGLRQYVKHYFQPYPIMFPINLIEELVKPFTLALRLFGNIFAGGIMVAVIGLFSPVVKSVGDSADAEAATRVADLLGVKLQTLGIDAVAPLLKVKTGATTHQLTTSDARTNYNIADLKENLLFANRDGTKIGFYDDTVWLDPVTRNNSDREKYFEIALIRNEAISPPPSTTAPDVLLPVLAYTARIRWPSFVALAGGTGWVQIGANPTGTVPFDHSQKQVLFFSRAITR